jgi:hypothetical protein
MSFFFLLNKFMYYNGQQNWPLFLSLYSLFLDRTLKLLSRRPGSAFEPGSRCLYFCAYLLMACGHQRRGASPTPDQEETNG